MVSRRFCVNYPTVKYLWNKWAESLGFPVTILAWTTEQITGGPSSSCEMIILRDNNHGGIIRVCMGIFTTALRNKIIRQILKKNTSTYFHSVLLVIWPLPLMKRTHFSELSISRFSTYIRKAFSWKLLRKMIVSQLELRPPVNKLN